MRTRRVFTIAAVLVFAAGFFAACGDDNKDKKDSSSETTAASTSAATVTITAGPGIQFDTDQLSATAGKAVTFKIVNNGTVEHNLTIKDLKVDKDAEVGESAEQTVTPAAGTYEFHCEYHPSAMKGTLTVS